MNPTLDLLDPAIGADPFPLVETANGWRCPGLGEWFQAQCRTPEWRAALTVYNKYRRKLNLERVHLLELRQHVEAFAQARQWAGKPAGKDFLIQEASAYCKQTWLMPND